MSARRRKRRGRRRVRYVPRLVLIGNRTRYDLARHGRLFALAAVVLNERAAVQDAQIFAVLCSGVMTARGLARKLLADSNIWNEAANIRDEYRTRPAGGESQHKG